MHLDHDRRWILAAIPEAHITVVRLLATDATLQAQREIGSGQEEQVQRTLRQACRMAGETSEDVMVLTRTAKGPRSSRGPYWMRSGG